MLATAQGLACLTPALIWIRIFFSSYTASIGCLIRVLLSKTDNNEERIEKVFNDSLWEVHNFLNAFHKILLLMAD
jgi:hypothetical protein